MAHFAWRFTSFLRKDDFQFSSFDDESVHHVPGFGRLRCIRVFNESKASWLLRVEVQWKVDVAYFTYLSEFVPKILRFNFT